MSNKFVNNIESKVKVYKGAGYELRLNIGQI